MARVGPARVRGRHQLPVVDVERPDGLEGPAERLVVGEGSVQRARRALASARGMKPRLAEAPTTLSVRTPAGWRAAYIKPRTPPQEMPRTWIGPRPRARRTPSMSARSWSLGALPRPRPARSARGLGGRRRSGAAPAPARAAPPSLPGPTSPCPARRGEEARCPGPTTSRWSVVPLTGRTRAGLERSAQVAPQRGEDPRCVLGQERAVEAQTVSHLVGHVLGKVADEDRLRSARGQPHQGEQDQGDADEHEDREAECLSR